MHWMNAGNAPIWEAVSKIISGMFISNLPKICQVGSHIRIIIYRPNPLKTKAHQVQLLLPFHLAIFIWLLKQMTVLMLLASITYVHVY